MNLLRTLFLTISVFYVSQLSAQFEKGRIQFGADVFTYLEIGDGFPFHYKRVVPEVSYFLFDNLSLGLSGFYKYTITDSRYPVEGRDYSLGLISRYYFMQRGSFSLFGECYLGFGERIAISNYYDHLNFHFSELKAGLGLGMIYHIIPNAALSFSIRNNRLFVFSDDGFRRRGEADFLLGLKINLATSK